MMKNFTTGSPGKAALLAALATALPLSSALAEIDQITVTARLVEEDLQEAPLSITALTAETLENARIRDVDDLANFTPNLTFEGGPDGRRQTPVIRGLGVIDTRGFDNNVGVFVDGVFISGRASQNIRMLDLERVEVVRGPQSALYGRNTFSGAINYVTRRPDNEFQGRVELTAGQDDLYELTGSVSGPLIQDKLSGLISFNILDDDGQFKNRGSENIGGQEDQSVYAALRFTPTDALDINVSAFYSDEFLESRPLSLVPNNCGELVDTLTVPSYDAGLPAYFCGTVPAASSDTYSLSPEAYSFEGETFRTTLDINYQFANGIELTSITSYTNAVNLAASDLDRTQEGEPFYGYISAAEFQAGGSPPFIFLPNANYPSFGVSSLNTYVGFSGLDQEYFSQELRLNSAADQRLRWVAGLFVFDQQNEDTTLLGIDARPAVAATGLQPDELQFLIVDPAGPFFAGLPTPVLPNEAFRTDTGLTNLVLAETSARQYAAFGSLEYDFTDKLTGTVELRYTYEERDLENVFDIFFGTPASSFKDDWSFVDPRFIVRYQATDDFMAYGSISRGSRSGGLNVAVSNPNLVPFQEERNWTYEAGFKSEWFDNKLQWNLSAFYIDWTDAQFRQRLPDSAAGTGFLTATTNATGITAYGFETNFVAAIADGVSAGAGVGYTNPEYDDGTLASGDASLCDYLPADQSAFPGLPINCVDIDSDGDGAFDDLAPEIGGTRPIRTSKVTANAFVQAIRPVNATWDWLGRVDAGYRSEQPTDNVAVQFVPSRTLVNARLGLVSEKFDLVFWAENLFDEDAPETTNTFPSNLNSFRSVTTAVNINQRRYGLTARYRF
ncbi:MAG: TonB-dependent receptor [Gammaproteobacteria bacterium]|jgi:iron complex outermembrane receptor protein|nr:TonB-dependent receptor [Gammaproteobacteria bacterium]